MTDQKKIFDLKPILKLLDEGWDSFMGGVLAGLLLIGIVAAVYGIFKLLAWLLT